ncbi:MAG: hypothetical protein WCW52_03445 [Elusimicrobiales bacterium]
MTRKQRRMIVTEFVVSVYADGRIDWDGIDCFMWWLMHQKPREGFLPHARRINALSPFLPKNG